MIGLMNYNLTSKETTGKSQLDSIQRAYLKSLKGKSLTEEQLEQIEAHLVTNPNMMDNPAMYQGLEKVAVEFEMLKQSIRKTKTENYTR